MADSGKNISNENNRVRLTTRERQRIAEKNKRRRIRRMRFVVFSASLLIVAVISGAVWGFLTVFKIDGYTVEGNKTYSTEQVFKSSGLLAGKNLFFNRLDKAALKLEETLPYIGTVEIYRIIPDTIKFKITETKTACALKTGDGFLYLNSEGKILENKSGKLPSGLPLFQCTEPMNPVTGHIIEFKAANKSFSSQRILETYKELVSAIETNKIRPISSIDMSEPDNISLVYDNRITLILGVSSKLESRLKLASKVLVEENIRSKTQKGTIDLTDLKKAYFKPLAD